MKEIGLKEALISSTFAPNRAISAEVTSINLDPYHQKGDQLFKDSVTAPGELALPLLVTADKRLLLKENPFIYGEYDLIRDLDIQTFNADSSKEKRQKRFIGTLLRTTSEGRPFNIKDVYDLMLPDTNPVAHTALYAVSMASQTLVFRGEEMNQLPEFVLNLAKPHVENLDQFLTENWRTTVLGAGQDFLEKMNKSFDLGPFAGIPGMENPFKSVSDAFERMKDRPEEGEKENRNHTLQFYKMMGLRVFTCPANERIAKLY